jgi:hypothetical protein
MNKSQLIEQISIGADISKASYWTKKPFYFSYP